MEVEITNDDYREFTGTDLYAELGTIVTNDVGDEIVQKFIDGVYEWVLLQIKKPPYNFREFRTDYQKECFKKAVISQIQYVIRNGNIANESGISETNIIPRSELDKIKLSGDSYDYLRIGGLMNLW